MQCMHEPQAVHEHVFVVVCCALVHGVCCVVGFGLFVSVAIFPNDDMAKI